MHSAIWEGVYLPKQALQLAVMHGVDTRQNHQRKSINVTMMFLEIRLALLAESNNFMKKLLALLLLSPLIIASDEKSYDELSDNKAMAVNMDGTCNNH